MGWDFVCMLGVGESIVWAREEGFNKSQTPLPFKEQLCIGSSDPNPAPRHSPSFETQPETTKLFSELHKGVPPASGPGTWELGPT